MSWFTKLLHRDSSPSASDSKVQQREDSLNIATSPPPIDTLIASAIGDIHSEFQNNFVRLLMELVPILCLMPDHSLKADEPEGDDDPKLSAACQDALAKARDPATNRQAIDELNELYLNNITRRVSALAAADAYELGGDIDGADTHLITALVTVGEKSAVLERMALLYENQGKLAQATACYMLAANAARPGSRAWRSFDKLAVIYRERGDVERADSMHSAAERLLGGPTSALPLEELTSIRRAMTRDSRIGEIAHWGYPIISDAAYQINQQSAAETEPLAPGNAELSQTEPVSIANKDYPSQLKSLAVKLTAVLQSGSGQADYVESLRLVSEIKAFEALDCGRWDSGIICTTLKPELEDLTPTPGVVVIGADRKETAAWLVYGLIAGDAFDPDEFITAIATRHGHLWWWLTSFAEDSSQPEQQRSFARSYVPGIAPVVPGTFKSEDAHWVGTFKQAIIDFLTDPKTRDYEQQTGSWWTRENLKLVIVRDFGSALEGDRLFPLAEAAVAELEAENRLIGIPSGYRAP